MLLRSPPSSKTTSMQHLDTLCLVLIGIHQQ